MKQNKQELLLDGIGERLNGLLVKHNAIIAGGAITSVYCGRKIEDYDVYFKTWEDMEGFLREDWCERCYRTSSEKAMNFVDWDGRNAIIQAITLDVYPNAEDIWDTFDFTVCMGLYDCQTGEFKLHPDFLEDNTERVLNFNPKTPYPIVSLKRVKKYEKRGYTLNMANLYKIALSIQKMSIDSYDELCRQLGGMYGDEMEEVFDQLDKDNFDIDAAIKTIDEQKLKEHQDILGRTVILYPLLVSHRLGRKIYYDDTGENQIILFDEDLYYQKFCFVTLEDSYRERVQKTIETLGATQKRLDDAITFPVKFCKYVKVNGEKYCSFYESSFEYKEGEVYEDVFGSAIPDVSITTYSDKNNRAFVCGHIESFDDIEHPDFLRALNEGFVKFKRFYVDKIIPLPDHKEDGQWRYYPDGIDENTPSEGAWEFDVDEKEISATRKVFEKILEKTSRLGGGKG